VSESLRHLSRFALLLALGVWGVLLGRSLRDPQPAVRIVVLVLFGVVIAVAGRRLYGYAGVGTWRPRSEPAAAPALPADGLVDINAADAAALQQLPGVGPVSAERIVEEREAGGPFASVEELTRVAGFGPAKVRVIAGHARV
jgi:competence ComEA-like helix-hairpin-helix protein